MLAGINNSTRHRSQDQVAALHQLEQARSSRVLLASVFALARWVRYTASYHPNHPCGKRILCTGGSQSSPRPTASIGGVAGASGRATGASDTTAAAGVGAAGVVDATGSGAAAAGTAAVSGEAAVGGASDAAYAFVAGSWLSLNQCATLVDPWKWKDAQ